MRSLYPATRSLSTAVFLRAEWRDLLIINYEVAPERLTPFLPAHTSLELFQGKALVSLVGFRFVHTRILGLPIPWHGDFDEMNLRFYLTRTLPDGSVRRGVTFLGEIVPRRMIAWVARVRYGEPYRHLPMRHATPHVEGERIEYRCRVGRAWHGAAGRPTGPWRLATDSPATAFITEHYWGYTRRSASRTDEYEVRHPIWRVREVSDLEVDLSPGPVYGEALVDLLPSHPHSSCFADGSPVTVHQGTTL
jgi:uncharacterized protein YqjF (DUF2071 family)